VDYLASALDRGMQVDAIYFDFRKAFDTVDHYILLQKLEHYGIGNPLISWINSYLHNRIQYVKFHNNLSRQIIAHSGVPQGSHLGPVLFLVFIHDLSYVLSQCSFLFFADDLKIYNNILNDNDIVLLQNNITNLSTWCYKNNMSLNVTKCKVITFSRKRQPVLNPYHIEGSPISRATIINDLGVIFDEELRFTHHIDSIIAKAFKMTGFVMRQCWDFKNVTVLKNIYFALIRSHLEYCCMIWNPYYAVHSKRIERVQSK
jgi:hypothetical protein